MRRMVKMLWNASLGRFYQQLFRRFFAATISRLDTTIGEVRDLKAAVDRMDVHLVDLDHHVSQLMETRTEQLAITRRVAAIEDFVDRTVTASDREQATDDEAGVNLS